MSENTWHANTVKSRSVLATYRLNLEVDFIRRCDNGVFSTDRNGANTSGCYGAIETLTFSEAVGSATITHWRVRPAAPQKGYLYRVNDDIWDAEDKADDLFLGNESERKSDRTVAPEILAVAVREMKARETLYDTPGGERSMANTVAIFNIACGTNLSEEQGWKFMSCLKLVRSEQGDFQLDNYVDLAAYAALCGEAAVKGDRNDG